MMKRYVAFSLGILVALLPFVGACPSDPSDPVDSGPEDADSSDADIPEDADVDAEADNPMGSLAMEGFWATHIGETEPLWGNGIATVTSEVQGTVTLTIEMDDGQTHFLAIEGTEGNELVGYYALTMDEFLHPESAQNWQGTLSHDGDEVQGTRTSGSTTEPTVFYRALPIQGLATGVWTRDDDATAIFASDGASLLISVLDESGDWADSSANFEITLLPESPLIRSSTGSFEGYAFRSGIDLRLHATITNGGEPAGTMLFTKSDEPPGLTGRYILGDRQYEENLPRKGVALVVEHNDVLFIHESRDDTQILTRTRRADLSDGQYHDDVEGWVGHPVLGGSRIVGEFSDYDRWYHSYDRTVEPRTDELNGEWYSISVDWAHHNPDGSHPMTFGQTSIVQNGDSLEITDEYEEVTYRIEATWVGDHYEGHWYDVSDPDSTSPWRGELAPSRLYIHGTWSYGEYSFSVFPMTLDSDWEGLGSEALMVTADPYAQSFVRGYDEESGVAFTIERNQERETAMTITSDTLNFRLEFDERYRMTGMTVNQYELQMDWRASGDTADVRQINHGTGEETTTVFVADFSDSAFLDLANQAETELDADVSAFREWIGANPGSLGAVFRGEEQMRGVVWAIEGGAIETSTRGFLIHDGPAAEERITNGLGTLLTFIGAWALTAQLFVWADTLVIAAALSTCLWIAAFVVFGLVLLYTFYLILTRFVCDPCTLSCFWNCEPLPDS